MHTTRLSLVALLALLVSSCAPEASEPLGVTVTDDAALVEDALAQLSSQGTATRAVDALRLARVATDLADYRHVRFAQLHHGVTVFGAEAIVHYDADGSFTGTTDGLLDGITVNVAPFLDRDDAIERAIEGTLRNGWEDVSDEPAADLVVLRHEGVDHLAYKVQLRRLAGDTDDTMPVVFVDAHDGSIVWSYENLQSATCSGSTNYYGAVNVDCYFDGTSYFLEDGTERMAALSYNTGTRTLSAVTSTSPAFGTSTATVRNAFEAHWAAQQVYTYYLTNHGRTGIDGAGGPFATTQHGVGVMTSATSYSTSYVNAYWDGTKMTYGDGDGVNSGSLTSLDIGGHEMTHGVTQYEANLTYSGESGHLNEAISDIFGAMVERSVRGESPDTWKIGEAAWTPATAGDALRYMNDPALDGVSWDYASTGIGSVDVHYGSGVPNLAFYLLAAGGTHPRGKSTTTVVGIGADEAADIWYLALANYMTASTTFASARTATISAATALYGASSPQVTSVGAAWTAVGVEAAPPPGSCTTAAYSGSISRAGRSVYAPSSSGVSAAAGNQTLTLTGPSSANFDVRLQKVSGRSWSTVATGAAATSTESVTYSGGTSGTYRVEVVSRTGTGAYSLSWCKP